jgi:5-methylcytosine-specific restriction endonuclease McrA
MKNYPADWEELRRTVVDRHLNRCVNCRRVTGELQVHHIVPVSQGGSHQTSNLVPLCPQCHKAAHRMDMGPRVRWYTNGELSTDEFGKHLNLWKQMRQRFGAPRYDPDDDAIYVPLGDVDEIADRMRA